MLIWPSKCMIITCINMNNKPHITVYVIAQLTYLGHRGAALYLQLGLFFFTLCNEWISKACIALIRSNLAGFHGFEFRLQEQFQVTNVTGSLQEREYMHVCHGATSSVCTLLRQRPEMSGTWVLRCYCQGPPQAPALRLLTTAVQHFYWESPDCWL